MQLKHRAVLYQRAKEKEAPDPLDPPELPDFVEEAWLNDTMPISTAHAASNAPIVRTIPNPATEKIAVLPSHIKPVVDLDRAESEQVPSQIENILRRAGRRMKPDWPMIDVRLPDGVLVNVVLPPGAVSGPTLTIRTARKKPLSLDNLVQLKTLLPC